FSGLRSSHLSNHNANSLFQSTIQVAIPVQSQLGDMVNAVLTEFISSAQKFGEQVNAQRKSKLTDPLREMDQKDDNLLSEIKGTVVFMLKSRELNKKAAAENLKFFLAPYWDANRHPMKTQAEDMTDMFAKYHANPALLAAATEIGVAALFTELEVSNVELTTTYLARNNEIGKRSESGSDLRPAVETGYTDLCNAVEQTVNFMPSPVLLALFNDMDALRRKYAPLATESKDKPTV
ncbi:MAG TPA: DUF6261 family protein, partial [Paludibacter sp.]|nr:DUF6261 family protein [Paludibacter sp.]